jgi:hypothetical protein
MNPYLALITISQTSSSARTTPGKTRPEALLGKLPHDVCDS